MFEKSIALDLTFYSDRSGSWHQSEDGVRLMTSLVVVAVAASVTTLGDFYKFQGEYFVIKYPHMYNVYLVILTISLFK